MGRLVQPPTPVPQHRPHPTRRTRSQPLPSKKSHTRCRLTPPSLHKTRGGSRLACGVTTQLLRVYVACSLAGQQHSTSSSFGRSQMSRPGVYDGSIQSPRREGPCWSRDDRVRVRPRTDQVAPEAETPRHLPRPRRAGPVLRLRFLGVNTAPLQAPKAAISRQVPREGPRGTRMRLTPGDAIPHRILRRPICGPIQRRWGAEPSRLTRH